MRGTGVNATSARRARGAWLLAVALLASCGSPASGERPAEAPAAPVPDAPATTSAPTPASTPTGPPASGAPDGTLEVHFIDAGQADATLLVGPDATILIDTGHHTRSDVVAYLRGAGVEALDLVAITHPHADHVGQFDQILAAFEVTEVWWSGATHTTQTFDRALTALEASEAFYEEPRAGDTTTIGSLLFEVVNPPGDADFGDLHDSGLSLRVTYGQVRFLFTGDVEASTEQRMVSRHRDWLGADVYQVGHHGSRTSTSAAFLDAVSPSVAVYSAGARNAYGHPHPEVVGRLIGAGVDLYGTDVHGTVVVTSDGTGVTVTTQRDAPPIATVLDGE